MNVTNQANGSVPAPGRPQPERTPPGGGDPSAAGETGGKIPAPGRPQPERAPQGGGDPSAVGETGGKIPAPGRPQPERAPSGGGDPSAAGETGGKIPAPGRPQPERAPSGGGDPSAAGETGGKFSLRRQLLLWLLLPQLLLWLMGGVLAYRVALVYAEKALDESLSQSVLALSRQVKPLGSGLLVDFPRRRRPSWSRTPATA